LLGIVLLSMAVAMVEDRSPRGRLHVAARVFICCGMTVLGGSWLMYMIHG
jgi:hypothetical protein